MRKLTRKNLDELALRIPVLSEEVQSSYVGGGNGTREDPFTLWEYKFMGTAFTDGWVDLPDSISYLTHDYYYYFGGSGSDGEGGDLGGSSYDGTSGYWGGSGYDGASGYQSGSDSGENNSECKPSCVFFCLNHLDGDDDYDMCDYSRDYINSGGTVGDRGQIPIQDIFSIAAFGGLKLTQITDVSTINEDDGTVGGCGAMMAFLKDGLYHSVILKGYRDEGGKRFLKYYDPMNGEWGETPLKGCFVFAVSRSEAVVKPSGQ